MVSASKVGIFKSIYQVVRQIPCGKVSTYGRVAAKVSTRSDFLDLGVRVTPRMVGWALHANKDPNTPCHRVVDRNGELAPSYAFGGWKTQREKLVSEGVGFWGQRKVNLDKHLW
jgi:methylated-DNA-protein-cysteine methyltransferase-like protein